MSELTPQEFYELMVKQRDRCFDYMEGTDLTEFKRWEKLYCAYSTIVDDMDWEEKQNRKRLDKVTK